MLVGVLGAPDSGVTPMLNILAKHIQAGDVEGKMLYHGESGLRLSYDTSVMSLRKILILHIL